MTYTRFIITSNLANLYSTPYIYGLHKGCDGFALKNELVLQPKCLPKESHREE